MYSEQAPPHGERGPRVSVVLTTYNRSASLRSTIESILAQTFQDFELIVCDDRSPDDTPALVRRYTQTDPRIRYHRREKNLGMPANLSAGIRAARGEYIANLHDDDEYSPQLLERWTDALDRYPSAGFVFNAYRQQDAQGRISCTYVEPLTECQPGAIVIENIFFRRWRFDSPIWGTTMVRRSAYEAVGLFNERFGFLADVDMWLRLAERFDVAYVSEPLITLAARDREPRQWRYGWVEEQRILERIFWEARRRHFRERPARLALEIARHALHVVAARSYKGAVAAKGAVAPRAPLRARPHPDDGRPCGL